MNSSRTKLTLPPRRTNVREVSKAAAIKIMKKKEGQRSKITTSLNGMKMKINCVIVILFFLIHFSNCLTIGSDSVNQSNEIPMLVYAPVSHLNRTTKSTLSSSSSASSLSSLSRSSSSSPRSKSRSRSKSGTNRRSGIELDPNYITGCHRREYTFKATNQDSNGKLCYQYIKTMSCWGRCDSGEIPDWEFPFKKSFHPMCSHGKRIVRRVRLKYCEEGADEMARMFEFVEAANCVCKFCQSSETSCEGLPFYSLK